ncbi:hypothetical protein [uncultured Amnibacterium sp.]|uniref:hypothetical protein n=1 Tax=uncultured Amnibacterium sp. TaxID=1631851 RepID=UPI0035CC667B
MAVLDYAVALARPGTREQVWFYWTAVWATPIWFTGFLLLLAVPAIVLVGRRAAAPPLVIDGLLTVAFGLYCFGTRISPPTGDQLGWWKGAATNTIAASETLADLFHKVPFWLTHDLNSVRLVSPVFGVLTIAAYLVLARRLSLVTGLDRDLLRVFVIATPLPFWFVAGYIENTFLGLPLLLLGLDRMIAYTYGRRLVTLVQGALLLGCAVAVHLLFLTMAVAVALTLLLSPHTARRARAAGAGLVLAASVAVPAAVIGLLMLTPLHVFPGNTNGGYDKQLLTPWMLHAGEWPNRFTMLSHAHAIEFDNIVVQAAPLLVLVLPALLILAIRGRRLHDVVEMTPVLLMLAVMSVAYIAFIAVFGFDYGPVGDLDLMLVLSTPFSLFVLLIASTLLRRRPGVLVGLVLGSAALQFAFYTLKVATAWTGLS